MRTYTHNYGTTIEIDIMGMSREDFDRMPGQAAAFPEEAPRAAMWTKSIGAATAADAQPASLAQPRLIIHFYTAEPPTGETE